MEKLAGLSNGVISYLGAQLRTPEQKKLAEKFKDRFFVIGQQRGVKEEVWAWNNDTYTHDKVMLRDATTENLMTI